MSHVLLKVWKTDKFFNVMRHGQVSWGDIKITSFSKLRKTGRFSEFMKRLDKYFRRGEKNTKFFEYMKKSPVFQSYEKQTSFSNLWKNLKCLWEGDENHKSNFKDMEKITSIGRTNTSPNVECEKRKFTND